MMIPRLVIKNMPEANGELLRSLSDKLIEKYQNEIVNIVVFSSQEEKLAFVIRATKTAVEKGFTTDKISKIFNEEFKIKSGGRKDFVQGGGKVEKPITDHELLKLIERNI